MDANGTTHEVRQANRVAEVSDALDNMSASEAARVWKLAQFLYLRDDRDDLSFLAAFESAIKRDKL